MALSPGFFRSAKIRFALSLSDDFVAEMKAPRWLCTADGVKFIDKVDRMMLQNWHPADIIAGLKKRGTSLSALSRQAGLASSTLTNALTRRWPNGERLIAEALGIAPEQIWPARYR